jgi:hypothetical protein
LNTRLKNERRLWKPGRVLSSELAGVTKTRRRRTTRRNAWSRYETDFHVSHLACSGRDADRVTGGGKKLFADGSAPHSFKLTRSRVSPNGLIVGHYEREGEIKTADTALPSPSEREVARQERMKREG